MNKLYKYAYVAVVNETEHIIGYSSNILRLKNAVCDLGVVYIDKNNKWYTYDNNMPVSVIRIRQNMYTDEREYTNYSGRLLLFTEIEPIVNKCIKENNYLWINPILIV